MTTSLAHYCVLYSDWRLPCHIVLILGCCAVFFFCSPLHKSNGKLTIKRQTGPTDPPTWAHISDEHVKGTVVVAPTYSHTHIYSRSILNYGQKIKQSYYKLHEFIPTIVWDSSPSYTRSRPFIHLLCPVRPVVYSFIHSSIILRVKVTIEFKSPRIIKSHECHQSADLNGKMKTFRFVLLFNVCGGGWLVGWLAVWLPWICITQNPPQHSVIGRISST